MQWRKNRTRRELQLWQPHLRWKRPLWPCPLSSRRSLGESLGEGLGEEEAIRLHPVWKEVSQQEPLQGAPTRPHWGAAISLPAVWSLLHHPAQPEAPPDHPRQGGQLPLQEVRHALLPSAQKRQNHEDFLPDHLKAWLHDAPIWSQERGDQSGPVATQTGQACPTQGGGDRSGDLA